MNTGSFNSMGANPFKFFESIKFPQFDYDVAISACCKNVEAISQAQQKTMETLTSVSQMQAEFARNMIQETGQFLKSFTTARTMEEKVQLQNEAVKHGLESAVSHGRQMGEKLMQSHKDLTSHVNKSWNENVKQARDTMKSSSKKG